MKTYLLALLVLMAWGSPALADYRVAPASWNLERVSQATTVYFGYIQKGTTGAMGAAGQVNVGSGTTSTVVTFPNNTGSTPKIFEWGWCGAATVSVSNPIHPTQWFREVQTGSGQTSQHGPVVDGKYYDTNGTEVNPDTGEVIDPEDGLAKANIDLPSLFSDRPTEYQIILTDSATGEFIGMTNATAFPGVTNGLTLSADRPFDYTWAPIIDGIADGSLGGSGSSTGGTTTNAGQPVTVPPTVTPNNPVVSTNPNPTAVSGTDTAAVKGAVDRLAGINLQGFNDNKVANGIIQGQLNDLYHGLQKVEAAIKAGPENEGTEGLTQAQVQAAVTDGVNGVLGQSRTGDNTATDAMQSALDAKSTVLNAISGIKTALNGTVDAMGGLVTALNLEQTYGTSSMTFAVSFGPFGSYTIDLEAYSGVFDTIRLVTLFMLGLLFVQKYFVIVRGALVG